MTVLKVSKMSNPHAVAGAIAGLVRDNGEAVMQAIGAGATNQAVKAIAIARSFMRDEGADLVCAPGFMDVDFNGETRTALRFEIASRSLLGPRPDSASQDGDGRAMSGDRGNLESAGTSD
jgi:stage V sporulation protein S